MGNILALLCEKNKRKLQHKKLGLFLACIKEYVLFPLQFDGSMVYDHGIWSHQFMANRWGNNGNSLRLYFGGAPKIAADGDCSHEIKRRMLLGRKAVTNLDSILKSRDITLPTKICVVKAVVFSVVMYGCESWTIKKAEC